MFTIYGHNHALIYLKFNMLSHNDSELVMAVLLNVLNEPKTHDDFKWSEVENFLLSNLITPQRVHSGTQHALMQSISL